VKNFCWQMYDEVILMKSAVNSTLIESHRPDMDMALDKIVPEGLNWLHTDEGPEFVFCFTFFYQQF
jgi:hypothetical protein